MSVKAVHVLVSGAVQGVGYRQACRQRARALDLLGWVRNLPDGRVEVFAQGEEDGVNRLLDWMWIGPPASRVVGVESDVVATDANLTDFFIQPAVRGREPGKAGDSPPRR